MMRRSVMAAGILLAAALPAHAQNLTVEWTWKRAHQCTSTSPEIRVGGVPAGTRLLRVRLVDNDVPTFRHGGGEVPHDGSGVIREGALKDYTGPCPPNFSSFGHDYTFTVTAVGEGGKELATASATRNFSARSVPQ